MRWITSLVCGLAMTVSSVGSAADLQSLIDDLNTGDTVKRYQAAEAIGELGGKAVPAIPDLINHLEDGGQVLVTISGPATAAGTFRVYDAAQTALAAIGKPAVQPLIELVETPGRNPFMKHNAVETLGRIPGTDSYVKMLDWMGGPVQEIRHSSAAAIGNLKETRALPRLAEYLKSSDSFNRANAALAVGMIGETSAGGELVPLLRDPVPEARREAVTALGRLKYQPAAGELVELLRDSDPKTRDAAFHSYRFIRPPAAAVPLLVDGWKNGEKTLRHDAEESLRDVADPEAAVPLGKELEAAELPLKKILVAALGNTRDIRAIEPLRNLLRHEDQELRRMAAIGLGRLERSEAAGALLEALRDGDKAMTQAAEHALLKMKDPSIRDAVNSALGSDVAKVREVASRMLPNLKDTSSVEALLKRLDDPDVGVRTMAVRSLGMLKDKKTMGPLIRAYLNADTNEGLEISTALSNMTSAYTKDPRLWLAWWEWKQRHPNAPQSEGSKLLLEMDGAIAALQSVVDFHDKPPPARRPLSVACAAGRDPSWTVLLAETLSQETDSAVRRKIIGSFEATRDLRSVEALLSVLGDKDPELRKTARQALSAVTGKSFDSAAEGSAWWEKNRDKLLASNPAAQIPAWDIALARRILAFKLPPSPPPVSKTGKNKTGRNGSSASPTPNPAGGGSKRWPALKLEGISGDTIILSGKVLGTDEEFRGVTVVEIGEDSVKLKLGDEIRTLQVGDKLP